MDDSEKPQARLANGLGALRRLGRSQRDEPSSASHRGEIEMANRLETLRLACAAIAATLDPQEVLTRIAHEMCGVINATSAHVCTCDPMTGTSSILVEFAAPHANSEEGRTPHSRKLHADPAFGREMQAGHHLVVHDHRREPPAPDGNFMRRYGVKSLLAIPLPMADRPVGFVELWESRRHREFNPGEIALCQSIAQQAATTLDHARLYQEARDEIAELRETRESMRQQSRELAALVEATSAINSNLSLETVLETVAVQMTHIIGSAGCALSYYDRELDRVETLVDHNTLWPDETDPPGTIYRLKDYPLTRQVLDTRQAIVVQHDDPLAESSELAWMERDRVFSMLMMPLVYRDTVIGLVELVDDVVGREYTPDEIRLARSMASQAAIAIQHARLYEQANREIQQRKLAEDEQKRLLTKTQRQAQQMQKIIDTVPEGILLLNADREVILANPAAVSALGALGETGIHEPLTHVGGLLLSQLIAAPGAGQMLELSAQETSLEIVCHPVEAEPAQGGWVLAIRDITQQREAQQYLQEQERLAAVGQLAAGIAHDFNNIMAVIVLYSQMLLRSQELASKQHQRLTAIVQQARRATELVQQILDFGRRSMLEKQAVDLVPLLSRELILVERALPPEIQVVLTHGPGELVINADPARVQQLIMNLAINARDAMPQGGELCIHVERMPAAKRQGKPALWLETGDSIALTVADTGCGIPEEILPRIFEPFFTTRAPLGRGLGLAQVYGIVKQHDGHIEVASRVGFGSTFIIHFPALSPAGSPGDGEQTAPAGRGPEKVILVVDDDALVRRALLESLKALDYQTLEAESGRDALDLYERHGGEVALVLTDLVMPEMGGEALAEALHQKNPAIKVIVLTGHSLMHEGERLREAGILGWLQKPVSLDQMASSVAQALVER